MHLRKTLAAIALVAAAATLALVPAAPAVAQEVVQDEGAAYRAWHDASQAGDNAKAMAAAKTYLEQYPKGQYADFIKKWYGTAQMTALDAAIKEKRTADMIAVGREILAADPENLNVLYALAFNIRRNELLAAPPVFTNAPAAVEFSKQGDRAGRVRQDAHRRRELRQERHPRLADPDPRRQRGQERQRRGGHQALREVHRAGAGGPAIAARNLLAIVSLRQAKYGEVAKAYNALPEADRAAAEPKPEVKAAKDALNVEADALIDAAAGFVAFGRTKNLPAATVDRVNQLLETVYKGRFPEDATLDGLKKILAAKGLAAA